MAQIMMVKRILGTLMIQLTVVILPGCGGKDTHTGPQEQTLEVETQKWDNGNNQVELYQIGGTGGISWTSSGTLTRLTEQGGSIRLTMVDSTENLAQRSSVLEISPGGTRTRDLTGWLTDGDPSTYWELIHPIMEIDLGMSFPIYRIGLRCHDDKFPRGYEISVNDGRPESQVDGQPIWQTIAYENSNEEAVIDLTFPDQEIVRYIRFRMASNTLTAPIITDIDIRAMGEVTFGSFVSHIVDLGNNAVFGRFNLEARTDHESSVLLLTRTGSLPEADVYYQIDGDSEKVIQPIGSEESRATYEALDNVHKGSIVHNGNAWSFWSRANEFSDVTFPSPDNLRYVQFRLDITSTSVGGMEETAEVESIRLEYATPPYAEKLIGEIDPPEVEIGAETTFDYFVKAEMGPTNSGFDQIEIWVPDGNASAKDVKINGHEASFTQRLDSNLLVVSLVEERVMNSADVLHVRFTSQIFRISTNFWGRVLDTSRSDYIGQTIIPGDAVRFIRSNSVLVYSRL